MDLQRIELASGAGIGSKEELEVDFKKLKQIKNRMRRTDWLFLNACVGEFPEYDLLRCVQLVLLVFCYVISWAMSQLNDVRQAKREMGIP